MTTRDFLAYVFTWGAYGILGFTLFLVFAATTKLFQLVRDENMELKKPMPRAGLVMMGGFVLVIFTFFLMAARIGITAKGLDPSLWAVWLMNFLVFFLILLFDTFIIDILVLVVWHPDFLNLPDKEAFTSIQYHLKTLFPGTLYSIIVSLAATIFAWIFIIH